MTLLTLQLSMLKWIIECWYKNKKKWSLDPYVLLVSLSKQKLPLYWQNKNKCLIKKKKTLSLVTNYHPDVARRTTTCQQLNFICWLISLYIFTRCHKSWKNIVENGTWPLWAYCNSTFRLMHAYFFNFYYNYEMSISSHEYDQN